MESQRQEREFGVVYALEPLSPDTQAWTQTWTRITPHVSHTTHAHTNTTHMHTHPPHTNAHAHTHHTHAHTPGVSIMFSLSCRPLSWISSERGETVVVFGMRCAAGGGAVRSLSSMKSVSMMVDLPRPASPKSGGKGAEPVSLALRPVRWMSVQCLCVCVFCVRCVV